MDATSTISDFFVAYYLPVCLGDASLRTLQAYGESLNYWRALTDDPPVGELTPVAMRAFVEGLKRKPLANNTVRKHMRHIQAILDRAGPAGPRRRDAAGIIATVPWVKPPRQEIGEPVPTPVEAIAATYSQVDAAMFPVIAGIVPSAWWRACLSLICSTSLRIGQVMSLPYDSANLRDAELVVPAAICRKSKREQRFPLHAIAVRDLFAVRGKRELLFPWDHSKTTIYAEFHRLQELAGVQAFGFHGMRRAVLDGFARSTASAAAQKAAGHASAKTTMDHYISQAVIADALGQSEIFRRLEGIG